MNKITSAERGKAPRILAAWRAVETLLADDEWHDDEELQRAATDTGIVAVTASNLLADARRVHRVQRRDGRTRRTPA